MAKWEIKEKAKSELCFGIPLMMTFQYRKWESKLKCLSSDHQVTVKWQSKILQIVVMPEVIWAPQVNRKQTELRLINVPLPSVLCRHFVKSIHNGPVIVVQTSFWSPSCFVCDRIQASASHYFARFCRQNFGLGKSSSFEELCYFWGGIILLKSSSK